MCAHNDPILLLLRLAGPILLRLLLAELRTANGQRQALEILVELGILTRNEAKAYLQNNDIPRLIAEIESLL